MVGLMVRTIRVTVLLPKSDSRDMLKEKNRLQLSLSELIRKAWDLSKDRFKAFPTIQKR